MAERKINLNFNGKALLQQPFHLRYPQSWRYQIVGKILSLHTEDNEALIIFFEQWEKCITENELELYLKKYLIGNDFPDTNIHNYSNKKRLTCMCSEFLDKEGRFWFVHSQSHNDCLLFACYNASDIPVANKARELSFIIENLQFSGF